MIRDEHWRWVKQERERIVGWQCEFGGCMDPWTDGHHVTYEREGREWPEDILLLCRRHHDVAHSLPVLGQLSFEDLPNNVIDLASRRWWQTFRKLGGPVEELYDDWRRFEAAGRRREARAAWYAYVAAEELFYRHCRGA